MEDQVKIVQLIFLKTRFNRFEYIKYINSKLDGKYKSVKLNLIDKWELQIAKLLTEHIEDCSVFESCQIELVFEKALKILELKKEEILSQKSFWENVMSNPIGLGIMLIGIGNLLIAIVNIMKNF